MYAIYEITSPSGKAYIGLTKAKVSERWRQHVKRAFGEARNHPFYNAIRKYGADAFTITTIDTAADKPEAQRKERGHIAAANLATLYNISPGGEADGEAGAKVFWDSMRADPVARAAYLQKLSTTKLQGDWTDYAAMSAGGAAWRKANPKTAYANSRRASRVAARSKAPKQAPAPQSLKERLLHKHYGHSLARAALWATRDDAARAAIGAKIGKTLQTLWAAQTPAERLANTMKLRAGVDKTKQGPAASKGLKQFWVDLKADPARYAAYMKVRTASLMKTIAK